MTPADTALIIEKPTAIATPPPSIGRLRLRRVARDPAAVFGAALLLVIVAAAVAAPWLSRYDPTAIDPRNALAGPSAAHPFGTDGLGRDILSRLMHGGRISIATAVAATAGIATLGLFFGVVSGMIGGAVDSIIMRVVECIQALPLLIVAMVAVGLLGGGADKLVVTVALVGWTGNARVVRAATLSIRQATFVDAARAHGASTPRVIRRHIVPAVLNTVTALSLIELGRIVLVLSALSFLGFGARPPNPEWGAMLADARPAFFVAPRLLVYPGVAILLLVLAVNLLGDGIRDAIDERIGSS